MANTYTQIHIHIVFTVQNQYCIISKSWKDVLYKYITGIIQNNGHKLLTINGMPDHIHLFIGMRPTLSISDLVQDVKGDSSKWINQKRFVKGRFSWQEGFGAFSYSKSHVDNVIDYIKNQAFHHKKKTFIEEYHDLLDKFGIEFDERYIFKPIEYVEE
jgi:putative transposase